MRLLGVFGLTAVMAVSFVLISAQGIRAAEKKTYPALELKASASDSAKMHNTEGMKQYKMGMWDQAEMHFAEAVKGDEKSAEAHYNYGLSLDKVGKHHEAMTEFDSALKLDPKNPEIADSEILKAHLKMMK
jgi:Flp pilus assembly protein TadD